ncbi:hypothetical protein EFB14_27280 [Rhizobium fabae]|uniref:Uncharacterized protein n=1 Tax=Rhizobium fabae TaxID=573179 RepID=A0ABY0B2P0_9HYPH|nr:hypothetical protein EFB14_27280 [Rhizobium fabae]
MRPITTTRTIAIFMTAIARQIFPSRQRGVSALVAIQVHEVRPRERLRDTALRQVDMVKLAAGTLLILSGALLVSSS